VTLFDDRVKVLDVTPCDHPEQAHRQRLKNQIQKGGGSHSGAEVGEHESVDAIAAQELAVQSVVDQIP